MVTFSPGPTPASFPKATPNVDLLSVMLALTLCLPPNPPSFFLELPAYHWGWCSV